MQQVIGVRPAAEFYGFLALDPPDKFNLFGLQGLPTGWITHQLIDTRYWVKWL